MGQKAIIHASILSPSLNVAVTIYYRTPSVGGIGGGTVLSIKGRGFAEDVYASSNVVWLQGGDGTKVLCDFIRFIWLQL